MGKAALVAKQVLIEKQFGQNTIKCVNTIMRNTVE